MPPVLLMVCLGNICRSPTAEATLVAAAAEAGVDIEVRSAGTGSWHVGAPPDERMRVAAAAAGVELRGVAQQVDAAALRDADLVLAMDHHNLADLRRLAEEARLETPIRLFREFDPQAGGADLDVPDPYYGGPDGFDEVVAMCRRTSAAIVSDVSGLLTS